MEDSDSVKIENAILKEKLARRAAYVKQRHKGCIQLYFGSEEEKNVLQEVARSQGYRNFSEWCRQMIYQGKNGSAVSGEYVAALKADVARLTQWVEQKDQQLEVLRRDVRILEQQKEDLRVVLASLAHANPEAARALTQLARRP